MTESFAKVTCLVAPGVVDLYLDAARRILPHRDLAALEASPPEQRTAIVNGIVLEYLVADFLSGPPGADHMQHETNRRVDEDAP